ncbi:hypothetical protein MTR67_013013 [Solanum verrucosum]|uniref:Uncharacterized protein n=1 Tax=Solanum verrucosum TaxID=315347 RepID=A0AAF0TLH1_SOLVR|nr:hypothetical protein MTR67_013013 [Solanum verrucosum]
MLQVFLRSTRLRFFGAGGEDACSGGIHLWSAYLLSHLFFLDGVFRGVFVRGDTKELQGSILCNYHLSIQMAPFESLYGRHCHTLICWFEASEPRLRGTSLFQKALDRVKAPFSQELYLGDQAQDVTSVSTHV